MKRKKMDYPKPEPFELNEIYYCPYCIDKDDIFTEINYNKGQFLCDKHYPEWRREKEAKRIKDNRKENIKVGKTSYNGGKQALGTSNISPHRKKDFVKEIEIVKKEVDRIFKGGTIGDFAIKKYGAPKIEQKKRVEKNLFYDTEEEGYIQFDDEGLIVDKHKPTKEYEISGEKWIEVIKEELKDVSISDKRKITYKDWKY